MYPTIRPGDLLETIQNDSFAPGDVVVYIERDVLVAHRVVCTQPGHLWTRGDGCRGPCSRVPRAAVCGKVVGVRRGDRVIAMDRWLGNMAWVAAPWTMRTVGTVIDLPRRLWVRLRGGPRLQ